MITEKIRNYFLSKKATEESFPFDETTLVFKVKGKMFGLMPLERELTINLKCDPEKALELREEYSVVKPGFHMNKKHWNTIEIDGSIPVSKIFEWIDDSYDLVVAKLTKKQKEELRS